MSTISGHRTFRPTVTTVRPWQARGRRPVSNLIESLRRTWRRGGEMSRTVDDLRDAAWRLSGATNHTLW